jgi:hypothetical protein
VASLNVDVPADQAFVLLLAVLVDQIILLRDQGTEVEADRAGYQPRIAGISRVVKELCGCDQILRR